MSIETTQVAQWPEWMDLRVLQRYAAISERTLRQWLHRSTNPLPAARVGTKILVRRSAFDQWLEDHRVEVANLDNIVDGIVAEVKGRNYGRES